MTTISKRILEQAEGCPEGTPLSTNELLHLGKRAAVDQALSRLTRRGKLIRVGRGLYVRPVEGRFGARAPSVPSLVEGYADISGETIVPHGAASANALGLTTQVPVRTVYLTSGPNRKLRLGAQTIELRHASRGQLALSNRPGGEVIRALSWLGPSKAAEGLRALKPKLSEATLLDIAKARRMVPAWMAQAISEIVVNG